jgi:hypothetical protein
MTCGNAEVCFNGACVPDPCQGVVCPAQQSCVLTAGTAQCAAAWEIREPEAPVGGGAGEGGSNASGGSDGAGGTGGVSTATGGESGAGASSGAIGDGPDAGTSAGNGGGGGGGGCTQSARAPVAPWLLLGVLPLVLRRRRRG